MNTIWLWCCGLGPVTKNERKLYFHSFASIRESWVYSSVLQNKSLFENGLVDGSGTFFVSPEVRETQSSVEVMTNDGILFSALMDNSLVCWNSQDQFTFKNIYSVYKVSYKPQTRLWDRRYNYFSVGISKKKKTTNITLIESWHALFNLLVV